MIIEKETFMFLKALARQNNREWFQKNKGRYLQAQNNVVTWLDELITEMNKHDRLQTQSGKESLYRIYNDVRFSADKTPYNPRFAGNLKRVKPYLRGGYYFWIKPGASRIGCGFTYPSADDLLRIRKDIELNEVDWRKLLTNKKLQSVFGDMLGDQLKTAPKGFARESTAIDLLRYKQFWFEKSYTDADVTSKTFLRKVNDDFKAIRPFFDYMTEVLTTDTNGVSLLE
jgi:uncharacterized protein (TIGR02453 family)